MTEIWRHTTHKSMIHAECPTGLQAWDYYEIEATFDTHEGAPVVKVEDFERLLNGFRVSPVKMFQEDLATHLLHELKAERIVLVGRHGRTTTRVEAYEE